MVGSQDPTRSETDGTGGGGRVCDQNDRWERADRGRMVMFGVPDPPVAQVFEVLCEVHGVAQGFHRRGACLDHRDFQCRKRYVHHVVSIEITRARRGPVESETQAPDGTSPHLNRRPQDMRAVVSRRHRPSSRGTSGRGMAREAAAVRSGVDATVRMTCGASPAARIRRAVTDQSITGVRRSGVGQSLISASSRKYSFLRGSLAAFRRRSGHRCSSASSGAAVITAVIERAVGGEAPEQLSHPVDLISVIGFPRPAAGAHRCGR